MMVLYSEIPTGWRKNKLMLAYFRLIFVDTLFYFGCTHSIQKFLDQGSNPCHSSDNTGSFTTMLTGKSLVGTFRIISTEI